MAHGIIFDVDGTLVDSNEAHARAWAAAGAFVGFNVGFSDVRPLMGMGGDKLLPALFKVDADSPVGQAIVRAHRRIFRDDADSSKPDPADLLGRLATLPWRALPTGP